MRVLFKEIYQRINSETPSFFKKVGNIGASIAASAGAILVPEVAGAHMPDTLVKIATHALVVGGVMKALSHLACVTPPDQPKQ